MKLACVSHQSHTKATSSRGAVASPRDYNRSHPRLPLFFRPFAARPRSRHLRTTPNPCRTCLGSTRRYRNDVRAADGEGKLWRETIDEKENIRQGGRKGG